jgi:hypothetical protein
VVLPDLLNGSVELDVETFRESDWNAGVSIPDCEVTSGESESVVLIPVLERQVAQGSGVGELQVGKVPVDDL